MRATPSAEFVFNPEALAGLPVVYYGGVRMQPSSVGALQRAVFEKFPDHDRGEHRRRAGDRAAGGGSDRAGDPVPVGIRDSGRRDHPGGERRGDALPQSARSSDSENPGRDAAACAADFLGRVPDAGRGRGPDGGAAGRRVFEPGAEAAAGRQFPVRLPRPPPSQSSERRCWRTFPGGWRASAS